MDIIALILFGFLLLIFILAFRHRHHKGYERMMKDNNNVVPLLKERSAQIKYNTLYNGLQSNPQALQNLEQLHTDVLNNLIGIDEYSKKLDEMTEQYLKH